MHYWWCSICERVAVDRQGDTCVRCAAAIEAICYPSDRIDCAWKRHSLGARLLNFIRKRY